MMDKMRQDAGWKNVVIAILTTAVMTSAAGWVGFASDTVSREEVQALATSVQRLADNVSRLETTVAVLNDRLMRGTEPIAPPRGVP